MCNVQCAPVCGKRTMSADGVFRLTEEREDEVRAERRNMMAGEGGWGETVAFVVSSLGGVSGEAKVDVGEEVVLDEGPLFAQQAGDNVGAGVVACGVCLAYIGDGLYQLDALVAAACGVGQEEQQGVECPFGCGMVYCSEACAEQDQRTGHGFVCPGGPAGEVVEASLDILSSFDDGFVFACRILASIVCSVGRGEVVGSSPVLDGLSVMTAPRWSQLKVMGQMVQGGGIEEEEFRADMAALVGGAAGQIGAMMAAVAEAQDLPPSVLQAVADVVTPDNVDALLGLLQTNQVGIRRRSPVASALLSGSLTWEAAFPLLNQLRDAVIDAGTVDCCDSDGGDGEEEDIYIPEYPEFDPATPDVEALLETDLLVPLDGVALLPLVAGINHACDPNMKVTYDGGEDDGPLVASLVPLRPVGQGDGVTISYLPDAEFVDGPSSIPQDERSLLLLDYGFVCQCPCCP